MREKPIAKCNEVMINICRFASANAGLRRKRSAIAVDVREWKELEWRDYATGRLRVKSKNGTLSCGGGGHRTHLSTVMIFPTMFNIER